jgi:tRNA modification GTPase
MNRRDTIVALATPPGEGGIGILRLSGDRAIKIADRLFCGKFIPTLEEAVNFRLYYGHAIYPDTRGIIDEVLVSVMRAPHSYTAEDVVEFNCHGGMVVLRTLLELILKEGARLAEPGEFTKRAFLNGRIDLSQAEAVIDVIRARTEGSLKVAISQLTGRLSAEIRQFSGELVRLIAHMEALIDYPEEEIPELGLQHVRDVCLSQIHRLTDLINTAHEGRIMREGLKAVICGKPNVGKSSLLNALLRYERAIVTDIPGTTRDVIEEVVNIKGIPLVLLDTAGIRKADNLVERLGIEQSISSVENADIVLFMIDINSEIDGNDLKIAELLKGKNVIIVANKVDLEEVADIHRFTDILGETRIIKISVLRGTGLDLLEQEIHSMALGEGLSGGDSVVISNVRHKNGLEQAKNNLVSALEALDSGIPLDLVLIDIREAAMQLGTITGEHISEDIIDSLFRDFCIGK